MKRRYTDEQLKEEFDSAKSIADLLRKFGIYNSGGSAAIVKKHLIRLGLDPNKIKNKAGKGLVKKGTTKYTLEEILVEDSYYSASGTSTLKRRILREGLLKEECYICGQLPNWNKQKLVLVLDHINGNRQDNRIQNLRLVCPNCNSQLSTFCGRNAKK